MLAAGPGADVEAQWKDAIKIGKSVATRPKFTDEDEGRMAQAQAQKFDAEHKMWPEPLLETYLTGMVQKLVAVAKPRPFPYRVRVVSDPTLNAFTFGGGLLYVHAGLIARMENEAQLAMVLGHEIAHVTEKHVTKGIEQAYTTQLIGSSAVVAGASTGILPTGDALNVAYDASMNAAVNGHGRGQEREADKVGMDYMVKAGYDPREGPITFELLLKEHGDQSRLANFFYGSHPNNVDRYETLSALVKDKYASDVKDKRLVVNTEEFKRVTRSVVIATGRLDYETAALRHGPGHVREGGPLVAGRSRAPLLPREDRARDRRRRRRRARPRASRGRPSRPTRRMRPRIASWAWRYYRKGDRPNAIGSLERYLALDPKAEDTKQIEATVAELKRFSR